MIKTLYGVAPILENGGKNFEFVADNTQDYVTPSVNISQAYWQSMAIGTDLFYTSVKPFVLKSVGLIMPCNFTLFDNHYIKMGLMLDNDQYNKMESLFYFTLPFENYELELNQYIEPNSYKGEENHIFKIGLGGTLDVSMLNCPDSYNTLNFTMRSFIKVEI